MTRYAVPFGLTIGCLALLGCGGDDTSNPVKTDAGMDSGPADATMDTAKNDATPDAAQDVAQDIAADVPPADMGSDGSDGAAACNTLTNGAMVLTVNALPMDAPPATGGTLLDGTYYATVASLYIGTDAGPGGPTANMVQYTSAVAGTGTTYELIGQMGARLSGTIMTNGSNVAIIQTCPTTSTSPFILYTVTGNDVTFYTAPGATGVSSLTFTKQ